MGVATGCSNFDSLVSLGLDCAISSISSITSILVLLVGVQAVRNLEWTPNTSRLAVSLFVHRNLIKCCLLVLPLFVTIGGCTSSTKDAAPLSHNTESILVCMLLDFISEGSNRRKDLPLGKHGCKFLLNSSDVGCICLSIVILKRCGWILFHVLGRNTVVLVVCRHLERWRGGRKEGRRCLNVWESVVVVAAQRCISVGGGGLNNSTILLHRLHRNMTGGSVLHHRSLECRNGCNRRRRHWCIGWR
mmetsp:Transcript_5757/g.10380  ORF Transcript_5757/g.10380 Transcript_5757/m.10380 type:complete len:246 (+) Transcript_5757:468-1205(+)